MTERDASMTTPEAPLTPVPPPLPVQPVQSITARAGRGDRWINLLLGAAALVAVAGVAFAVGRGTAPASSVALAPDGGIMVDGGPIGSFAPGSGPQVRPGGPDFAGVGGPTVEGVVTAIDGDSITVRLASGDEISVAIDADTTYHEATAATAGAVAVGDEVAVHAEGGRLTVGGGQDGRGTDPATGSGPELTAGDVTVRR
jgi:hypothetical protein